MVPVQVLEGLSMLSMQQFKAVIADDRVGYDINKYGRHSKVYGRFGEHTIVSTVTLPTHKVTLSTFSMEFASMNGFDKFI